MKNSKTISILAVLCFLLTLIIWSCSESKKEDISPSKKTKESNLKTANRPTSGFYEHGYQNI
jgi:hypothetical protein